VLVVGTVVWLASEVLFFAGLFAAYFTIRATTDGPWPPRDVELETVPALAFTLVLVLSSLTMHRAVAAGSRLDSAAFRRWLVLTAVLAAAFLANQAREWASADFRPETHAYGSSFFVMTGFHGLHVFGGVLAMLVVLARLHGRPAVERDVPSMEVLAAYWHFVDVVWIVMFLTLFGVR
jgi:cytochrome c oxidase subunit 3